SGGLTDEVMEENGCSDADHSFVLPCSGRRPEPFPHRKESTGKHGSDLRQTAGSSRVSDGAVLGWKPVQPDVGDREKGLPGIPVPDVLRGWLCPDQQRERRSGREFYRISDCGS